MKFLLTLFLLSCIIQKSNAQTSLSYELDKLLIPQFKADEPGGVVMVAKNGEVVYKKAFGMANIELNVPLNDSMIFYIGSNTKQFTAVAILQLIEKGKLQLQDTLGKFAAAVSYPVSSITIQELLSQTSGITEKNEADIKKLWSGQKTDKPILDLAPGKKWEYNNTNYFILGSIIEKTAAKSYAEYINENIFKPAGMVHSYVDDEASVIKNRAPGYRRFKTRFLNSRPSGKVGAAGGIMSTVEDMLRWNQTLKSNILLKPETLQQAFTSQKLPDGSFTSYGYGWYLEELHASPTRRHGGMVSGYTSETLYLPKEDVYVVILTNAELSLIPITALSRIIAGIVINKPYVFEEKPIDKSELKKFIGVYENEYGEVLNITEQDGKLVYQRPNGNKYKLGFAVNNEFFFDKDFYRVNFITDAAGKVKSLKFSKVDVMTTEWFKTQRPLLKLSEGRIAEGILESYTGKYFFPGADTITIARDGVNLYYTANNKEFLLAAEDSIHFFDLKNDLAMTFMKSPTSITLALTVTQTKTMKQYLKL